MSDRVAAKRDEELRWIVRRKLADFAGNVANDVIPISQMLITYAVFTLVMKREMTRECAPEGYPATFTHAMYSFACILDNGCIRPTART